MNTTTRLRILGGIVVGLTLAPQAAQAQAPVPGTPAPRYVYAARTPRSVFVRPARRFAFRPARRYAYTAPVQQRAYVPAVRTYYTPTTSFGRYRQAVDAGRDPNWATGRGVTTYKPWEY